MRRPSATTSATFPPSPPSESWSGRDGRRLDAVRVAAVDTESPRAVAAPADLTVPGAAGAVALLRALADAAAGGAGDAQP